MSGNLLDNILWNITDLDLEDTVKIDEEDIDENVTERLAQIPVNLESLPERRDKVIFLYPIGLEETEVVEEVIYNINDLPTALEILGAIGTHYATNLLSPPVIVGPNNIIYENFVFSFKYPRYLTLRDYMFFKSLIRISPGVYYVKLTN